MKNGRFVVANDNGIPFHEQPEGGYTYLQAICRIQREINDCIKLWGGKAEDYKDWFMVLDHKFKEVKDAKNAF